MGNYYYIITSSEELFKEWRSLEEFTGKRLGSSLVQNPMILPTEELNEGFSELNHAIQSLSEVFAPKVVERAVILRNKTLNHIMDCASKTWDCESIHHEFFGDCPYEHVKVHMESKATLTYPEEGCPLLHELNRTRGFVKSWSIPKGGS